MTIRLRKRIGVRPRSNQTAQCRSQQSSTWQRNIMHARHAHALKCMVTHTTTSHRPTRLKSKSRQLIQKTTRMYTTSPQEQVARTKRFSITALSLRSLEYAKPAPSTGSAATREHSQQGLTSDDAENILDAAAGKRMNTHVNASFGKAYVFDAACGRHGLRAISA